MHLVKKNKYIRYVKNWEMVTLKGNNFSGIYEFSLKNKPGQESTLITRYLIAKRPGWHGIRKKGLSWKQKVCLKTGENL